MEPTLSQRLNSVQRSVVDAINNVGKQRSAFEEWDDLAVELTRLENSSTLSVTVCKEAIDVANRINIISTLMVDMSRTFAAAEIRAAEDLTILIERLRPSSVVSPSPTPPKLLPVLPRIRPEVCYAPYRQYFMTNFTNPFPSIQDQRSLLLLVPSQTKKQLCTWFVNARRRSGWATVYNDAGNTQEGMEEVLRIVDRVDGRLEAMGTDRGLQAIDEYCQLDDDETNERIASEMKVWEAVGKIRNYFEKTGRDIMDPGLSVIIIGAATKIEITARQDTSKKIKKEKAKEEEAKEKRALANMKAREKRLIKAAKLLEDERIRKELETAVKLEKSEAELEISKLDDFLSSCSSSPQPSTAATSVHDYLSDNSVESEIFGSGNPSLILPALLSTLASELIPPPQLHLSPIPSIFQPHQAESHSMDYRFPAVSLKQ